MGRENRRERMRSLSKKQIIRTFLIGLLLMGALFAVIFLNSGQKYRFTSVLRTETSSSTQWSMEYASINGHAEKTMWLPGDGSALQIQVETSSGSLDIAIKGRQNKLYYSGEDLPSGEYTIHARGKIHIIIDADKHSGSFSVKKLPSIA